MLSTSRLLPGLALVMLFLLSGCSVQPANAMNPHGIKSIGMWLLPPDSGMAFCSFDIDGAMHSGHMSGDPVPFVHEDRGNASRAAIEEIWQAGAEALEAGWLVAGGGGAKQGNNRIYVVLEDGRELSVSWPFQGEAPSPQVNRLGDLIEKHHLPGSW